MRAGRSPGFESLYAKTQRAHERILQLDREVTDYLRQNHRVEGRLARGARQYRFLAFGNPVLPSYFSVSIGEILYQLRTTLDHLVFILAAGRGNPSKLEFPICLRRRDFEHAQRKGRLEGIPKRAEQMTEQFQPFVTSPRKRGLGNNGTKTHAKG